MDVEGTMPFILDQQAKFFAGLEALRQQLRQHAEDTASGLAQVRSERQAPPPQ